MQTLFKYCDVSFNEYPLRLRSAVCIQHGKGNHLDHLNRNSHVGMLLGMTNGASRRRGPGAAAATVSTASASPIAASTARLGRSDIAGSNIIWAHTTAAAAAAATAATTSATAIGAVRGAHARGVRRRGPGAAAATVSTASASPIATSAARLGRSDIAGSNIIWAHTTAAATATAATTSAAAIGAVRGAHARGVAAGAARLSIRQDARRDVVRAHTAAAASAGLLGHLRRATSKLEETDPHHDAHDRHGQEGVDKGQDNHAREDKQLENAHDLPVLMGILAAHARQDMGRKRRDVTQSFVEFSGYGSLNVGIVIDGLKDTALEAVVATHATSELGKTTVDQKQRSDAQ